MRFLASLWRASVGNHLFCDSNSQVEISCLLCERVKKLFGFCVQAGTRTQEASRNGETPGETATD